MSERARGLLRNSGSVRTRLIVWNVAALALILALLGGIIQHTVETNLIVGVDHDIDALSRHFLHLDRPPRPERPSGPSEGEQGFLRPPGGEDRRPGDHPPQDGFRMPPPAGMYEPHGPNREAGPPPDTSQNPYRPRVLERDGVTHFPEAGLAPWDENAFRRGLNGWESCTTVTVEDVRLRVCTRPMRRDGVIFAVLQSPYLLTDIDRAITNMNRTLLALIPVALLLAGFGGAMLTAGALRPIQRIAQTAERIGSRDLSQRMPVVGTDEFARLAATFNGMLGRLETDFAQREALVHQLETLITQERRFTADASHELKTPLTIVKANTSLLLSSKPTTEEYRESIADIDTAADTMSRLVQDLLLLSRYDGGQLEHDTAPLSMQDVLTKASRNVDSQASQQRRLAFYTASEKSAAGISADLGIKVNDQFTVLGDEHDLVRLFTNLFENAVRYTPGPGKIFVTIGRTGEKVSVVVADTGIGIAPEHLPHLGERFYRVDAARSRPDGGTGLGLSICKSIVAAHGGTMTIDSIVGEGTTVTVLLPKV